MAHKTLKPEAPSTAVATAPQAPGSTALATPAPIFGRATHLFFCHPTSKHYTARKEACPTLNPGEAVLQFGDGFLAHVPKLSVVYGNVFSRYWVDMDNQGKILDVSRTEPATGWRDPKKETIETVVLVDFNGQFVPARLSTTKGNVTAFLAMAKAAIDSSTKSWGTRSPQHELVAKLTPEPLPPNLRYVTRVSISGFRTSSGFDAFRTNAKIQPMDAVTLARVVEMQADPARVADLKASLDDYARKVSRYEKVADGGDDDGHFADQDGAA